jgi:hypothetical protein
MKTKVEINGYEIEIEEMEGRISVKAEFEGEVIEEFSIDTEEAQEGQDGEESEDGEGIKSFGDFGGEEEDFAGEEAPEGLEDEIQDDEEGDDDDDDDDDDDEEEENVRALESFQSFINKKK